MKPTVKIVKKDTGWIELFERAYEIAKGGKVKVGFLDEGPGAETHPGSKLTVAQIASILEFGTEDGHIPARSVVRSTFDAKHEMLTELSGKLIGQILDGRMNVDRALGILGLTLATEMKKTVTVGPHVQPENAPSTIAQKGSDRPWVDTGRTIGAATWALDKGGGGK